jgi:hypothetical protein
MSVDTFWMTLSIVWFAAWSGFAIYLFLRRRFRSKLSACGLDVLCIIAIVVPLAPLYLVSLYEIPWEVNTDEAAMIWAYRQAVADQIPNIFGLSAYWGFPNLLYLGYGQLAEMLGGISLLHSRLAHAITGLIALATIYMFIAVFSANRTLATVGTYLVGVNHSFIMISRMALRNHSSVITESLSLALFAKGWLSDCPFLTFAGGIFAGLAYFAYYPSRIAIILWTAFLVAGTIFRFLPAKKALKLGSIAIAGWLVLVVPHAVAMQFDSDRLKAHFEFTKNITILTAEGRTTAAQRQNAGNADQSVLTNIREGLTAFNSFTTDRSGIYCNPGFGFLDPVTGAMMWLGVLVAFVNRSRFQCAFALFYCGILWMMYSFVLNKAPDYTRMAILLPFIGWFTAMGLLAISRAIARLRQISAPAAAARVRIWTFAVALSLITGINLAYACVFAVRSFNEVYNLEQKGVGETARFIESHPETGRRFYLISDYGHMYYTWCEPKYWYAWLAAFIPHGRDFGPKGQSVAVLAASEFKPELFDLPGATAFMHKRTWQQLSARFSAQLTGRFRELRVHQLSKDGNLVAIERAPTH